VIQHNLYGAIPAGSCQCHGIVIERVRHLKNLLILATASAALSFPFQEWMALRLKDKHGPSRNFGIAIELMGQGLEKELYLGFGH